MKKALLLKYFLLLCLQQVLGQSTLTGNYPTSDQELSMTMDREYTHWFQKDKLTKWYFKSDLYVFRLQGGDLYYGYRPPIVDSIVPHQDKYSLYNLVYFSESSSSADRMKFIREMRRLPNFEFESGPVTQHPDALKSENKYLFSGDCLNVVFHEPKPSEQLIEWTEDRYGLKALHIPEAALPAPVDRSWAFQFQLLHNTAQPRDVFLTAYEMYLNDSTVFMIAEPTLEPVDARAGVLSKKSLSQRYKDQGMPTIDDIHGMSKAPNSWPSTASRADSTNDPYYPFQWHIENAGQCLGMWRHDSASLSGISGTVGADCNIKEAWAAGYTGDGVRIAVLDRTIYSDSHPDISSQYVGGFNFVNNTPDVYSCQSCPGVYLSHGQACAGLIGAIANNGIGTVGVAYDAEIVPYTTYLGDSYFAFQRALLDKVDIISASWLYDGNFAAALESDIENCFLYGRNGKGIVMVFPAGNEENRPGFNQDVFPNPVFPGTLPEVIGVIGSNPNDSLKEFRDRWGDWVPNANGMNDTTYYNWSSNFGTIFEVAAPCTDLMTTDQYFPNSNLYLDFWKNFCFDPPMQTDTGYAYFNGTSAATPVVAGVCAMILQNDTNFSATQVRVILQNSTDKVGGYNYNYNSAGQSLRMSHGRVNAYNAAIVGRKESLAQKQVFARIYPNPGEGDFQLQFMVGVPGDLEIEISNLLGQQLYFDTRNNLAPNSEYLFNFDLTKFPEGVYLVNCKYNEKITSLKLILQR